MPSKEWLRFLFPFFLVSLPPDFPCSTPAQPLHSPQSLAVQCVESICSSGWIIATWQRAQSSGGLASSTILLTRSDATQNQGKARGWGMPEERNGQNCPFQQQRMVKMSLLHSLTALSAYSQHSSSICFQHVIPRMVWARQGVLKPFYWFTPALWHFSAQGGFLLWMTSYEYTSTADARSYSLCIQCFSGSISFIFLRKAYSNRKALHRNGW